MSVVATPSVHALLRELVANSPRRHFLHDVEGIELSNQAALARDVVTTVQACLERDLAALRESERRDHDIDPDWATGPGPRTVMAIAQYDEILGTLLDTGSLVEAGRVSTAWALLGSAAERLRVLAALASPSGSDTARHLAATSAHARARFTAATAVGTVDLGLPAALESAGLLASEPSPTVVAAHPDVENLLELITLGAATGRDGGALGTQLRPASAAGADYAHLSTVGAQQVDLVLEIVRCATDFVCDIGWDVTTDTAWRAWADDVRDAVDFAHNCL